MKNSIPSGIRAFAAGVLVIAALAGCSKEELTKRELLTIHPWNFSEATTSSADSSVISLVKRLQAFMTGAVLSYQTDGTFSLDSPVFEDPETGTWKLSLDEKTLTVKYDDEAGDGKNLKIITLTETELVTEENDTTDDDIPFTLRYHWKK